jgi:hypothetical protein
VTLIAYPTVSEVSGCEKVLSALEAVQLAIVVGVFVLFGWEKERLDAETRRREAAGN